MTSILNVFKPDPYLPEIQDENKVKSMYQYWRIRILYSMFIGYALYYFTRKSFIFAQPGIIEDLHFTKGQLGYISSVFSISYGLSKFLSGILSDRSNPRYFMAFGLFMTGVANIFFGLSSSFIVFAIFWGLNGWFQGFGWPPCARFLTHWYSQSERGSWWSTWNVSHNVGAFMIPWVVGGALQYLDWRYAMYIPGVICIAGSLFLINRLRDTPQSLGLPPIEKFRQDWVGASKSEVEHEHELSTREILMDHVLRNPYIWLLAASYFFVYVVRTGVNDWSAIYLIEEKGYTKLGANGTVSLFEVGGFVGSLAAGWSSDYLFKAMRGPVNVIFAVLVLLSILLFWYAPTSVPYIDSVSIFLLGVTIFGPQMLIGVHAAELAHKKAAATSTGFIGLMAYIGAATAGGPLGSIIESFGWESFFICMAGCSAISIFFLLPLWGVREVKH
ncbi:MFS transporter [Estrella lausannensis]|uniref:Hexose phosphate transport protein n=1 Tax=Estrella lausannensis TaxID=483423 RepID=A0A0H5E3N1_9BACT|nr:MFS transporter [Estrella lausannensis]CRX37825.1 Hexose phosphate transport protein [Estrella lausannensis]